MTSRLFFALFVISLSGTAVHSTDFSDIPTEPTPGDLMLRDYFVQETRRVEARTNSLIADTENWPGKQASLRRELYEMLGLQPLPARSPLKAVTTGSTTRDGVIVENIVFQSRPGLYVTANFYRPEEQEGPLPSILYQCGHGRVNIDGISYGNKVHYQRHGTWFAKHGYTCLTIDTLQLGEIEGHHHGTYKLDRWWWNSRGYTPAGVEAWNAIRALDYMETRKEVDADRIGATGRSGGGAYTYWISALDERIKVSAPVAGITSMQNHVVDGCIEGHCDCMFMINTYRWDFPLLTSLIAPRPLLILNTDDDRIFPLNGVVDVFTRTRKVYEALEARENLGLAIYQGPHKDTEPLRVSAYHWFERHLKGASIEDELSSAASPVLFEPKELKVLDAIPENERNTFIDDYFTRRVPRLAKVPASPQDWSAQRGLILNRLKSRSFRGWPTRAADSKLAEEFRSRRDGVDFIRYSFESQPTVRLPLYLVTPENVPLEDLDRIVLNVLDEDGWLDFLASPGAAFAEAFPGVELPALDESAYEAELKMHQSQKWGMLYLPPRGIGPTAWTTDPKEATHIRRRFALLGTTIDAMRIWDIRRALQTVREMDGGDTPPFWMQSSGIMAGNSLYASLFEPNIARLDLHGPASSHRVGPELLNVLRFTDIPQVAAMASEKSKLLIYSDSPAEWDFTVKTAKVMALPEKQVEIRGSLGE